MGIKESQLPKVEKAQMGFLKQGVYVVGSSQVLGDMNTDVSEAITLSSWSPLMLRESKLLCSFLLKSTISSLFLLMFSLRPCIGKSR